MRSIQEVGTEILGGSPAKMYVMIGSEYGIKLKYIDKLKDFYGKSVEYDSVDSVLNLMTSKRLLPLSPSLYIVRYDDTFISKLSADTQPKIDRTTILGSIVVLYDGVKYSEKLNKYLPNYTVSIDPVSPMFLKQYLRSDYPQLPDVFINLAIKISADYNQCKLVCNSMNNLSWDVLYSVSTDILAKILGYMDTSTDIQIQLGVASRNFEYLHNVVTEYQGEPDRIVYNIISAMIELEKCRSSKTAQSDFRAYLSVWNPEDIYYMFCHAYQAIKIMRTLSYNDGLDIVYYLFGLLQQPKIPQIGGNSWT